VKQFLIDQYRLANPEPVAAEEKLTVFEVEPEPAEPEQVDETQVPPLAWL